MFTVDCQNFKFGLFFNRKKKKIQIVLYAYLFLRFNRVINLQNIRLSKKKKGNLQNDINDNSTLFI